MVKGLVNVASKTQKYCRKLLQTEKERIDSAKNHSLCCIWTNT